MKSLFDQERRIYMIGCGTLEDDCKIYDMKPNEKGVELMRDGRCVGAYSKKEMQGFISMGYATMM